MNVRQHQHLRPYRPLKTDNKKRVVVRFDESHGSETITLPFAEFMRRFETVDNTVYTGISATVVTIK